MSQQHNGDRAAHRVDFIRGTTPEIRFFLPEDLAGVCFSDIYVTWKQRGVPIVEQHLVGVKIPSPEDGCDIRVTLSQEETLRCHPDYPVYVQAKMKTEYGEVLSHEAASLWAGDALKKEVI